MVESVSVCPLFPLAMAWFGGFVIDLCIHFLRISNKSRFNLRLFNGILVIFPIFFSLDLFFSSRFCNNLYAPECAVPLSVMACLI